jgi:predicted dehydrogenase
MMQPSSEQDHVPTLRYAIIGCAGVIGPSHVNALAHVPGSQLVAMTDVSQERGSARAAEANVPFFTDHKVMLAEMQPDVAIICTPHPFHAALAIDSLQAGAHVLVEKPLAVEAAEGDAMIAAAEKAGKILAVNFQQRFRPAIAYAREFIQSGQLGELVRVLCVEPWYRTATYYRSAGWRGTWKGEGGGVLMNQAPHNLDVLCYLAGLPRKVWGWTRTRYHEIECEDTAQAMLEYPNGAPGYLYISTTEANQQRQLHIIGDKAVLDIVGEKVTIQHVEPGMSEHRQNSPEMWGHPAIRTETTELTEGKGDHIAVHVDLRDAILQNRPPRATGRDAMMSLELANAIILSSYAERAITLPIDRAEYSTLLSDLKAGVRR